MAPVTARRSQGRSEHDMMLGGQNSNFYLRALEYIALISLILVAGGALWALEHIALTSLILAAGGALRALEHIALTSLILSAGGGVRISSCMLGFALLTP